MFYWLTILSDGGDFFNLFRYITFRAGGAFYKRLQYALSHGHVVDHARISAIPREISPGSTARQPTTLTPIPKQEAMHAYEHGTNVTKPAKGCWAFVAFWGLFWPICNQSGTKTRSCKICFPGVGQKIVFLPNSFPRVGRNIIIPRACA